VILGAWVVFAAGGCASKTYRPPLPAQLAAPRRPRVDASLLKLLARPAPDSKLIEPGDLLEVTVDSGYGEQPVRTRPVWVAEDGTATIPLIGGVSVLGLTPQQAGLMIASIGVERGLYVDPYPFVTVERKRQHTNQVLVIGGGVEDPGMKGLPQHSSHLLGAIVAAGGLSDKASSEIEIIRNSGVDPLLAPHAPRMAGGLPADPTAYGETGPAQPRVVLVNLTQTTPRQRSEYHLRDGDTVVVKEREPGTIHVLGLVKNAGEFELSPDRDVYLLNALAMAGERTSQLADKVYVIRQLPDQDEPARIVLSVWKAKRNGADNIRLAPGDVVTVEETPVTFVLDMAQKFIRFGLSGSVPLF
jgi:polysaccharide export outer membrane protein